MRLIMQAFELRCRLEDLLDRMEPGHPDPYNDYWRERVEDLVMKAQARLERREAKVEPVDDGWEETNLKSYP